MRVSSVRAWTGAVLMAACAVAAPAAQAQQVVRLPAQDRVLQGRPAQAFSVGSADGQSWEMFSGPLQVAFDAADNLYVLDRGNHRVVVFDRSGRFVRQFGRRGGGPNEFRAPVQIAVTADGSVVVSDVSRAAFLVFNREGVFQRTVPYSSGEGLSGLSLEAHPTRGVLTTVRPFGLNAPQRLDRRNPGLREGTSERTTSLLWHPLQASSPPRVLFQAEEEVVQQMDQTKRGGSELLGRSRSTVHFAPRMQWAVTGTGALAVAHTAAYAVKVLDPNGRLVRTLQRPIEPRRVTRADREAARDRQTQNLSSGEGRLTNVGRGGRPTSAEVRRRVENMEFAEVMPVIRGIVADPAGRFWIGRTGAREQDGGPIDVVTAEGRYVGTLVGQRLPRAISPSGRAAYVERDDLGVERVVVKVLPREWRQ